MAETHVLSARLLRLKRTLATSPARRAPNTPRRYRAASSASVMLDIPTGAGVAPNVAQARMQAEQHARIVQPTPARPSQARTQRRASAIPVRQDRMAASVCCVMLEGTRRGQAAAHAWIARQGSTQSQWPRQHARRAQPA